MIPLSFLSSVSGCNLKCVMKEKERSYRLISLTCSLRGRWVIVSRSTPFSPCQRAQPALREVMKVAKVTRSRAKWERVWEGKETVKSLKSGSALLTREREEASRRGDLARWAAATQEEPTRRSRLQMWSCFVHERHRRISLRFASFKKSSNNNGNSHVSGLFEIPLGPTGKWPRFHFYWVCELCSWRLFQTLLWLLR